MLLSTSANAAGEMTPAAKMRRLADRDPVAEARAAAARGDFRLGAVEQVDPMGHGNPWTVAGVNCDGWSRALVGKWSSTNPPYARRSAAETRHAEVARRFVERYNRALVREPSFPFKDVCAVEKERPEPLHRGPVTTWGEAARSGDVAKLAAFAATAATPIDSRDGFGRTALHWAAARGHRAMMLALLARGADPSLDVEFEKPFGLLGHALKNKDRELVDALLAAGFKVSGTQSICLRELDGSYFPEPAPPLPGATRETLGEPCTVAGLMIAAGRPDLLDRLNEGGDYYEVRAAYLERLRSGDETGAARLSNYAFPANPDYGHFRQLYSTGSRAAVADYVDRFADGLARSPTEAEMWRAAAADGRLGALALLHDYGAFLYLLMPARAQACRAAAVAGDEPSLLACVQDAEARRLEAVALVEAGEESGFVRYLGSLADVRETNRPGLRHLALKSGTPAMLRAVMERAPPPRFTNFYGAGEPIYAGPLKADARAWAERSGYAGHLSYQTWGEMREELTYAADRGDVARLGVLLEAWGPWLAAWGEAWLTRRADRSTRSSGFEERSTEALSPTPAETARVVSVVAEAVARREGAPALVALAGPLVALGWNDQVRELKERGLDLSKVDKTESLWRRLTEGVCKPSTARLLVESGLNPPTEKPPLIWSVVNSCDDPETLRVIVDKRIEHVNAVAWGVETALDRTRRGPRRPQMEAILVAGGGLSGDVAHPEESRRQKVENNEERGRDPELSVEFRPD